MTYFQKYYLLRFIYVLTVSFTKVSFIPYLFARGASKYEVHLVYAIFTIFVMLFEVPCSAWGERVGPRISFLVGCVIKIIAALAFFYGHELSHFYFAEIVSALAVACISGSLNAWVMARAKLETIESKSIASVFMIGSRISRVSLALGGACGAYLSHYDLGYPWIFVAVGFVVVTILGFIILDKEDCPKWKKDKIYARWQWKNIREGYVLAGKNPILLVVLFDSFVISFALASPKMFWLPYLKSSFGKDMFFLGNMWLCLAAVQFLGTFGIEWLEKRFGSYLKMKAFFSIFSLGMLLGVIFCREYLWVFIVFYLLLEWAKPYHTTISLTLFHKNIDDEGRITILSLRSLVSRFGSTLGLLVIGWTTEIYSLTFAWSVGAFLYLLIIPCYFSLSQLQEKEVTTDLSRADLVSG